MVTLQIESSIISFNIELDSPAGLPSSDWNYIKVSELNGSITVDMSDSTGYITYIGTKEVQHHDD